MSASTPIILASRSRARVQMLQEAGYSFDIAPADIDEQKIIDDELAKGTDFKKIALRAYFCGMYKNANNDFFIRRHSNPYDEIFI